ncbi:carbohydrate-binding protein [Zobellia galactanivorans]|uniref:Endo-1,3-beta-glucanase, family GH16 n=1 Tax=Zobellia galactanivorans (strain DSM 12802 / CCUG 47099 / CIP 106680 / NCIMB 13871 / Dsij) TaxID=63186 RepID=G0L2L9_ZOBGA|nr:carbohydrate-binding protein [Zobellia galactanivorans]CAZ95067.1 Endo-1,3-beta-glucanase, family GH16 [Zobellia galactanivorans]
MKKIITYLLMVLCFGMTPILSAQDYNLVWQDEFDDGIGPDWVFETGMGYNGWGNNELQYYRRENAAVENGNLVITAKHENFGGAQYTSARMKTQGRKSFKYGKIEARIALPSGQGLWPAFWMLGNNITSVSWPACGEIDIMERINNALQTHGTIHWSDQNGDHASYGDDVGVSDPGQYHIYSVEWDANSIKWFVDGQQFNEVDISNGVNGTGEFQNEFFILLNMAVGGDWPGFDVDQSKLPAQMLVDYVRVYQKGDDNDSANTLKIEAESYLYSNDVQKEPCSEGGENVGYINNGSWMSYPGINFPSSGNYLIEYRVASAVDGGRFSSDLEAGETVLGELSVPNTGGWQNWTTVSQTVNVSAGTYQFGLYSISGGWNINWIRITKQGTASAATALNSSLIASDNGISQEIRVYPNPFTEYVSVNFDGEAANLTLQDMLGTVIFSKSGVSADESVDLSGLKSGVYFLTIEQDGKSTVRQLIKE